MKPRKPRPRFRQADRWIWSRGMHFWPIVTPQELRRVVPPSPEVLDEMIGRIDRLFYQKLAKEDPNHPWLKTERARKALEGSD